MIFCSHNYKSKICGFCKQESNEYKIELFGYNFMGSKAAICSNCLIEIVTKASFEKTKECGCGISIPCDFCGSSNASDPDGEPYRQYRKDKLTICSECIIGFISTSLWMNTRDCPLCF